MSLRVLVAGGSGFLGRNFILKAPSSWEIWATYRTQKRFPQFLKTQNMGHVTPVLVEMNQAQSVKESLAKIPGEFDLCLYVMGNSDIGRSCREPLYDLSENVHSIINLMQNVKVKKFIYMSSGSVYEGYQSLVNPEFSVQPTLPYSVSKLASEHYLSFFQKHSDQIDHYVILRFFGAYGPYEPARKVYTKLIQSLVFEDKNEFTLMGNGKNLIDAMYIDDAVEALLKISQSEKGNQILDFCRGTPLSLNELVLEASKIFEKRNFSLKHEGGAAEFTTFQACPKAMQKLFNFSPQISLAQGMRHFYTFLKEEKGRG